MWTWVSPVLQKLNRLVVPLLCIHPKVCPPKQGHKEVFINLCPCATLFTSIYGRSTNAHQCLNRQRHMVYAHEGVLFSRKKNEILTQDTAQIDLENTRPSGASTHERTVWHDALM
jgi:hypothetical protein